MAEPSTVFSEQPPPDYLSDYGAFSKALLGPGGTPGGSVGLTAPLSRDFEAERKPLLAQREGNVAAQRATVGAAQAETEKQATDAEGDSARQAAGRKGAQPGPRNLPATPSGEARPFLTPGPSVMSQLQALVLGVQQVGMQVAGLKGSAIAATSAIQGMATGWQKGDAERVQGEYKKWKVDSERLIAQHADAVDAYRRLVEDQKLSTEQKRVLGTLRLKGYDWQAAQQAIESQDIAAQLKEVDLSQQRHESLVEKAREFNDKMGETIRHDKESERLAGERNAEQARRTDETLLLRERDLDLKAKMLDLKAQIASAKREDRDTGYKTMGSVLNDMDALVDRLNSKKLLPQGTSWWSKGRGWINREVNPEDEDWRQWQALQGAMVGFERQVYNDKGARALAVYQSLLKFVDTPPTAPAAHAILGRMRGYLNATQPGGGTPSSGAVLVGPDGKEYDGAGVNPATLKPGWTLR